MVVKSFLNKNIILLRKGTGLRNIIFIHDGGGEVIQYMPFCKYINQEFNIYGIRYESNPDKLSAQSIDVNILSDYYLSLLKEQNIHPKSVYLIMGFCIGGKIAFDMGRKLRSFHPYIVFLNTLPPNQIHNKTDFSLKAEKKFLMGKKLPLIKSVRVAQTPEELWYNSANFLKDHQRMFRLLKHFMSKSMKYIIKKFRIEDEPDQIIRYMNLNRSFEESHYNYHLNRKKILEYAYYFNAELEPSQNYKEWTYYFDQVKYFNVQSTHIDLINPKNVEYIANGVLKEVWG